jgi:K+/H+ antiporter YhaU regulatory subunit KhtT
MGFDPFAVVDLFPSPDTRLGAGDRIVVMGEKAAIEKLSG